MSEISVARVQQALQVVAADGFTLSPGPVDNAWGERTHAALKNYLANQGRLGLTPIPPEALAALYGHLARVPARASVLDLPADIAADLDARARRHPGGSVSTRTPAAPTVPIVPVQRSSGLAVAAGLAVGALVVGGLAWWFLRD